MWYLTIKYILIVPIKNKDRQIHSKVALLSMFLNLTIEIYNLNRKRKEIDSLMETLYSQVQQDSHIKIQIYLEQKEIHMNQFRNLHRPLRKALDRGNPILLQNQMYFLIIMLILIKMNSLFRERQLAEEMKKDGQVKFLMDQKCKNSTEKF